MKFGAGSQSFEKHIDTQYKDQHHKDDGDRHVIPREIGAADMEIVIRRSEALAYHRYYADKHTPRCDTVIGRTGRLRIIL